jgi:hypothetical protein
MPESKSYLWPLMRAYGFHVVDSEKTLTLAGIPGGQCELDWLIPASFLKPLDTSPVHRRFRDRFAQSNDTAFESRPSEATPRMGM